MLELTDQAVKKVRQLSDRDAATRGKSLRVFLKAGGCAGYEYGFSFDDKHADDQEVLSGGISVLVDPQSAPYLAECKVDYVETLMNAGFKVDNPQAKSECGCGHSVGFREGPVTRKCG